MPDIIRSNATHLILTLKMDSIPVTNLADALSIRFIALNTSKEIKIDKDISGMSINDPAIGSITIQLSSLDTSELMEGKYEMAIQVIWGAGDLIEWRFDERLTILRELVTQD